MKITTYQIVQKRARVLMKVITYQPVPLSAKQGKVARYLRSKDQVAPEFGNQKSKDVHNQKEKEVGLLFYSNFYKYYFFSVNHLRPSFQYP